MKSIFTKLSTLLLCGAVAMVSCTDFSEDIQAVDNKVDNLGSQTATELANLESAITALESKLAAQYATKDEVAALKTTLEQSIASEVEGLSKDIAAVSAALKTAKDDINTAIAGLDNKKADKADVEAAVKTATDAIAALQGQLESAKAEIEAEIEAVEAEIAATQEELAAQINGVDAKANELHNTLLSLSEYLATLEAKINEVNNTLLSLSLFLEEYEASVDAKFQEILNTFSSLSLHLNEREALVDAQLSELQSTLISLSYHLEEYEAVTDFKLVELQGSLAALSTYLEEYEASVDAKFEEILNTFTSLDLFLDEQFAAVAANDEALFAHVETLQEAFTALNNLLADEAAVREENDEALYAHIETLQEAFTALNNIVADLEAEDEAIYAEVENVRTYVAQVYNALGLEIEAVDAALAAHVAAFEAYKEVLEAKLAGLEAEDGAIYTLIGTTTTALNNLIADLQAEDEAIYAEIENVRTYIAQIYNAVSDEVAALEAELVESVEGLESMIRDTQSALTTALNLIADVEEQVVANAKAITALEEAVEMLTAWAQNHEGLYGELTKMIANLAAELDEQVSALQAEDGAIYDLLGQTTTALTNLIEDANLRMDEIEAVIESNYNTVGAAIGALENLINDLRTELADAIAANSAAIEALLERVQSLVYVPDYNDHKATLDWAFVWGNEGTAIVPKASVLKYRVQAAQNDAAQAATDLATAWRTKMANLYFTVENVKTRSAQPALEILDVQAKGEYVLVTVLAKNFNDSFYLGEQFEAKSVNEAEGDIEGYLRRPASYSAALVLTDGNNNRSTEYTNFVPGNPLVLEAGLWLQNEEEEYEYVSGEEIEYLMPCNDYEKVETAVQPVFGFYPYDPEVQAQITSHYPFFTAEDLASAGYDVAVEKAARIVRTDETYHNQPYDGKVDGVGDDPCYNIGEDPEYDFHYSVKEGTDFDHVGEYSTVTYTYTCGDAVETLTYKFTLANAQVAINIEKNINWTVALQGSLYDSEKGHYQKDLAFEIDEFEAVGGPVISLSSALKQAKKSVTSYDMVDGEWVESSTRVITNKSFTETGVNSVLVGGRYSWNNSYKIVFVTTNEAEHVDYTTTMIVNLVGRPDEINVPVEVEYVLNGGESYFKADADLFGASFSAMEKYLGYADAAADTLQWKKIFDGNLVKSLMAEGNTNLPLVNGKVGRASSLANLAEARLSIIDHNNGRYTILEGEPNVTTWTGTPWFGIPVNFTVTGSLAALPYDLIYSEDYVTNGVATVYGQIENGKYTILKSDLAKYFNVDAESLDGHNFTVEFTVNAPKATATESVLVGYQEDGAHVENYVTEVVERTVETYNYLASDKVVLDWNTYMGLEVEVTAVLKMNGFERESLDLTLVTKDPLTITGSNFTVERQLRKDLTVQVFKSLVLTSSVEPTKENLIQFKNSNGTVYNWQKAIAYAEGVYGAEAEFVLGPKGLYHYDNSGKEIVLGANKYKFDATTGMITIYGDDAQVKNYYADFTVVFKSRICGGEHRVPVRITFTLQ